jgi:FkbM family methyltransferase
MLIRLGSFLAGERGSSLQAELVEARTAVNRWKVAAAGARARAAGENRRVLSTHVLKAMLPARVAAARARAESPIMRGRHETLLRESGAYRNAVDQAGAEDATVFAVTIGGLTWWVPASARQPDREARVKAQALPLRAILQTREVAVGPVMVDVGANIGRTSVLRVVLGDVGVVHAAEPEPDNYRCLVRTIVSNRLTGLVFPEHCGIGDVDGEISLTRSKYIGGHAVRPGADGPGTIRVPCRRLDSWLAARRVDLDAVGFVKVDVQGWETRVLHGAPAVLAKRHIAWQLEVDPQQLAASGSSLSELLGMLPAHFAHFVDLHPEAAGPRLRPLAELPASLGYLADGRGHKTDLILIRD